MLEFMFQRGRHKAMGRYKSQGNLIHFLYMYVH